MSITDGSNKPLFVHSKPVQKEWLDHNGHMNDGFYTSVAGFGFDEMMCSCGLTDDYRSMSQCTTYTLESHVVYLEEAKLGDTIAVHVQVLDADEKRVHVYIILSDHSSETLFAVLEGLYAHIDQRSRPKTAPWPPDIQKRLFALRDSHKNLQVPEHVGRLIGIRRKTRA